MSSRVQSNILFPKPLILQELWFVIVASLVLVVLLMAVVAVVCLRRKRKALHMMMGKNMAGHYNGKKEKYRVAHLVRCFGLVDIDFTAFFLEVLS